MQIVVRHNFCLAITGYCEVIVNYDWAAGNIFISSEQ